MENKIVGYILIASGIVMIVLTTLFVYGVFSGTRTPIEIVTEQTFLNTNQGSPTILDLSGLSSSNIIYLLNISFTIFFAGFLTNVGFKVASIGTQLVRPIVVDLNAKGLPKSK